MMNRRHFLTSSVALALAPLSWPALSANRFPMLAAYKAAYPVLNEGSGGECVACGIVNMAQGTALNAQGVRIDPLSWGFLYYGFGRDPTFRTGIDPVGACSWASTNGICADRLYPQSEVLGCWQNGFPYPPECLPSPQCYADALTRRIVRFNAWLPLLPDGFGAGLHLSEALQMIRTGYPVGFAYGNHFITAIDVSDDGAWVACLDPELTTQDLWGWGYGVRPFSTANLLFPLDGSPVNAFDFCVIQEFSTGSIQPQNPPAVQVPPATSVTDLQGHVWDLGAQTPPPSYGREVRRDGVRFAGGQGTLIDYRLGVVKVKNSVGDWWAPTFDSWVPTTPP